MTSARSSFGEAQVSESPYRHPVSQATLELMCRSFIPEIEDLLEC